MLIQIGVDELLGDYKKPFGLNLIKSLSIDYATNSIHGWLEDEEVIVFKFRDKNPSLSAYGGTLNPHR